MKIAILVLGYAAPRCLQAAVVVYSRAGFDVFVHVDTKVSLDDYQVAMGDGAALCRFIDDRYPIFWAGFNMIRAEMALLSEALKGGYSKFVLVSDDTFPLAGPKKLASFFDDDINRIDIRHINENDPFYPRYADFFILDHNATSLTGRQIELSCFDDGLLARVDELRGMRAVGKTKLTLYYGSQWWALTRSAAGLVRHAFGHNRHLVKSFEYSAVPDEIFVQSLIGNDVGVRPSVRRSCVHVDWTRNPRPYVYMSEIDLPGPSDEWVFIRKIGNYPTFIETLLNKVLID